MTSTAFPPEGVPARALDELYAEPPERFVARRNELAKDLRQKQIPEAAEWLRQLKRPTSAAALINRLVREEPAALKDLLKAGERLRQLNAKLGTRGAADQLRRAAKAERDAVNRLMDAVSDLAGNGKRPGGAVLDRVRETLEAAGTDEEARQLVEAGRLDRERRAASLAGLGDLGSDTNKASPGDTSRAEQRAAEADLEARRRELADAERAETERRRERDELEDRLKQTRRALREAEALTKKTRSEVKAAERRVRSLRDGS